MGAGRGVEVHLVDGTYELFRHYFGQVRRGGQARDAVRGVLATVVETISQGVTHVGVATDHVVESFRNDLWPGYKDSSGVPPDLLDQFEPLEEALRSLGVTVWAMTELEADDALASAAAVAGEDAAVARVVIWSPDKDLAQCVLGQRVVQRDRRTGATFDEDGIWARFGVPPASIPDWLALVGDAADGFPGIPGWGRRSAATLLARYRRLDAVPDDVTAWDAGVAGAIRGSSRLARILAEQRELATTFRDLATLRLDASLLERVEDLRWTGPTAAFAATCERLGAAGLPGRARAAYDGASQPDSSHRPA